MEAITNYGTKVNLIDVIPNMTPPMAMCEVPHMRNNRLKGEVSKVFLSITLTGFQNQDEVNTWYHQNKEASKSPQKTLTESLKRE